MFTGNENHSITLAEGAALTSKFRTVLMPILGGIKGGYFSQNAINDVLAQTDVVGIRIYLGLSNDLIPLPAFVIVGVNAAGNDITTGVILDRSVLCPPSCGALNILNS